MKNNCNSYVLVNIPPELWQRAKQFAFFNDTSLRQMLLTGIEHVLENYESNPQNNEARDDTGGVE